MTERLVSSAEIVGDVLRSAATLRGCLDALQAATERGSLDSMWDAFATVRQAKRVHLAWQAGYRETVERESSEGVKRA